MRKWSLVRIDSLYTVSRGGSPRPIKKFITEDENGINWIKISDATASNKYIFETREKIIQKGIKHSRLVKVGDLLLSNSMSFGRPYIMKTSGCIHDGWLVLSPKGNDLNQDFLYYVLTSPFIFQQFDLLAAGSTVRNLNINLVSGVQIPVPPIPEQKRIVAILDQAFADIEKIRANTEKNLKNARELFESYLKQVFSAYDSCVQLDKIANIARGGSPRPIEKYITDDQKGINWIKISDATASNKYIFKSKQKIISDGIRRSRLVNPGDLILSNSMSFGRPYIMKTSGCIHDGWLVLSLKNNQLNEEVLYYILCSPLVFKQFDSLAVGSTVRNLNIGLVRKIQIPLIPSGEQERIINNIEKVSEKVKELEDICVKKLVKLDHLKQSLLHQAFTGQLTQRELAA